MRSALGVRFGRDRLGGKAAEYKELKTVKEKAAFRAKWAAVQYEICKTGKTRTQNYKKTDVSKGVCMSFARIVKMEGGDHDAAEAATNYINACIKMKGDWLKWNVMTKRIDYLYMQQEVSELFEQSWAMYEEQLKKKEEKADEPEEASLKKTAKEGVKKGAKGDGQAKVKSPAKAGVKKKSDADKSMAEASAMKKRYQTITSQARLLLDEIGANPEVWSWAKTKHEPKLLDALKNVAGPTSTEFARMFLTQEVKDVKAKMTPGALVAELKTFTASFEPPLKGLELAYKLILDMKACDQNAEQ